MVGSDSLASAQVYSWLRLMVVVAVEEGGSGLVKEPALLGQVVVSNRLLEAERLVFVNQQSPHAVNVTD